MSSQARKNVFSNRLILFALIASVIFYWAGCSTTNPASNPNPSHSRRRRKPPLKGSPKPLFHNLQAWNNCNKANLSAPLLRVR